MSLPELLKHNVPQQISTKYKEFGTLLLKDGTGSLVSSISAECQQKTDEIKAKILEKWITRGGKLFTWEMLIRVLRM